MPTSRFFKALYPNVNVALHAGEMVTGMGHVTPDVVTFHVHDSGEAGSLGVRILDWPLSRCIM